MADPYRSQLDLNVAPVSGASAEDFGAGAAQGIERAGAATQHAGHLIKQRDNDLAAAQAGTDFANASLDLDRASQQLRDNAAAGAAGHTDAIMKTVDERSNAELGKIKDPNLRAAFTARYAALRANVVGREDGWEAGQRINKLSTDFEDMADTLAAGQASNPDPVGLQVSLDTIETTGRHLAVSADLQDKLIKEQQRKVAVDWGNAMQDKNPQLLVAALDHGVLNHYFEGNDVNVLRSGGLVEIRRQEAAAHAEYDRQKAQASETATTLFNKVRDGYVASDQEIQSTRQLVATYGLDSKVWDLDTLQEQTNVNRETRTWTPTQWHGAINELEAKGEKRSQPENVRLHMLEAAAPGSIARFNSDPFAAAAAAGTPAPQVDWTNPDLKSIESRVTWARSYARSAGLTNVPYLSNDELKPLRDRAAQGPAGQLEIAGQLRQTFGTSAASEIVRQVDPNSRDLQLMVGLPPRVAQLYKVGVEAQKAGAVKLGADAEDIQAMREAFQPYMAGIPAEMQGAIENAARNITAGTASEFAKNNPTGDELVSTYRQAIQRAGGMIGSAGEGSARGGFVNWNGRYAWLPQTMSRDDFQHRISRAGEKDWEKAGNGAPYYLGADGKLAKMSEGQVKNLGRYQLETVNPGLYRLVGPDGGHVVDGQGRPWQFDIRTLP